MKHRSAIFRSLSVPRRAAYKSPLVIYGLGNHTHPQTKHSLGQTLLEPLGRYASNRLGSRLPPFSIDKTLNGWTTSVAVPNAEEDMPSSLLFVKSKDAMNLSGKTAQALVRRHPDLLTAKRLIVLHDELSLAPGSSKGQFGGSAKGHKGLRSLFDKLKTDEFHRFRIGIGRPEDKRSVADWCLSPVMHDGLKLVEENGATTAAAWQYLVDQSFVKG